MTGVTSGRGAARPPLAPFLVCIAVFVFVVLALRLGEVNVSGILSTGRDIDFNTIGYGVGCFGSIGVLYWFLRDDRKARDTLRYTDWRGPISARPTAIWLTFASWIGGGLHLWFWAQDLTRP